MKILTLLVGLPFLWIGSLLLAPAARAAMPTVEIFARLGGTPDGYNPRSVPIQGADDNFYGTTEAGGPSNCGTIYRLSADGTLTTIYSFKDDGDGANPSAGLTLGPDGNLYGTTPRGLDRKHLSR